MTVILTMIMIMTVILIMIMIMTMIIFINCSTQLYEEWITLSSG